MEDTTSILHKYKNDQLKGYLQNSIYWNKTLFEHNNDALFATDLDGYCIWLNQSCQKITGYSSEEASQLSLFSLVKDFDLERVKSYFHKTLEGNFQNFDCAITNKSSESVHINITFIPISAKDEIIGVYVVAKDITEIKRNRKELQDLVIRSEKLSIAGQLAAGIAHEVRNPLTAIKGFLQLIKSNHKNEEAYFDIIDSEIDRVEGILSELLALAKPKSLKLERKRLDILLDQVIALINTQCILKNIIINKNSDHKVIEINCDENQLKQVFINFLKNSIEAMPNGGLITIEVKALSDKKAAIKFIDQGNGIPEEVINRIGEPFFTTKENGTGLGLMISKEIIEKHNGSINIKSDENGTSIEVILPLF